MPSSTVEDYLKHIYVQQQRSRDGLVPMGQLSRALDVTPGTVTGMVKALAESELLLYEPRSGVRLTAKGERLALHVLRRHRLVELFLVRVLHLDWSEVHEEAEHLEHALSDKVIDRMDQVLGHPTVDPHGDPIPTAGGSIAEPTSLSLADCREGQTVQIARIDDQDPRFLRFANDQGLTPGTQVRVAVLDPVADAVTIDRAGTAITLGTAAAGKIHVTPTPGH